MSERIVAVLDQIEAQQQQPTLPKDIRALELLQMVSRVELKETSQQMRAAIESLPYENAKLSAVSYLTDESFAARLDRAIAASDKAKLIEASRMSRVGGTFRLRHNIHEGSALETKGFAAAANIVT